MSIPRQYAFTLKRTIKMYDQDVECISHDGLTWRPVANQDVAIPQTILPAVGCERAKGPKWGKATRDGRKRNKIVYREGLQKSLRKQEQEKDHRVMLLNMYVNENCRRLFADITYPLKDIVWDALARWKVAQPIATHFHCAICGTQPAPLTRIWEIASRNTPRLRFTALRHGYKEDQV